MTRETTATNTRQRHARNTRQTCDALTLYLDKLASSGRRSMRSLLHQVSMIQGWNGSLENMPWLSLRYKDIANIRSELRRNDKSTNTINTTLAAIRGVLKAGFLTGQYPALEWQRVQAIERATGKPLPAGRRLTGQEIMRLLKACQDNSVKGSRDAAIFALMAYAGLRRSEVAGLNVEDYSPRNGLLVIRLGKGQKQRELLLPMQARPLLRQWLQRRGNAPGSMFSQLAKNGQCMLWQTFTAQNIYSLLRRRVKQAGIAHCSPHDLRRTFVTRLLDQGVDMNTTRQLAGHEHLQTTVLYDRRNIKTQRQAMANFSF
jgi:integrase/recombinase XerD